MLLNPPYDKAALGQVFIHNPAAFDPDGDSLSYKLTVCTKEDGKPITELHSASRVQQDFTLTPSRAILYGTHQQPLAFIMLPWRYRSGAAALR
ncbi:MAG: hypothetical protein MZV63_62060 [Marinilabiliales bacterium]|nr:hypothetical protein [Marinilabiliales bacterium]